MKKSRIAIPSHQPGGLAGMRSEHFGHCDLFTLVDITDGKIEQVDTIANVEHGAGGCLGPVKLLSGNGVSAMVVGGMGKRPLMAFQEEGIEVFYAPPDLYPNVQLALEGWLAARFEKMNGDQACQGNCHH